MKLVRDDNGHTVHQFVMPGKGMGGKAHIVKVTSLNTTSISVGAGFGTQRVIFKTDLPDNMAMQFDLDLQENDTFKVTGTVEHVLSVPAVFYGGGEAIEAAPPLIKIERAPGFATCDRLGKLCTPTFREEILEALHGDCVAEYQRLLAAGDLSGARIFRWMIYVHMVRCVFGGVIEWFAARLIPGLFAKKD